MSRWMLLLLGVVLIGLLSYFCFADKAESIEHDLVLEAKSVYSNKQMNWVDVGIKGDNLAMTRILTLNGMAPTAEKKLEAGILAQKIEGVTSINNQIIVQKELPESKISVAQIEKQEVVVVETEKPEIEIKPEEAEIEVVMAKTEESELDSVPVPYEVVVSKHQDNQIVLGGYVPDIGVHERLITEAKSIFGDANVIDNLAEAEGAPAVWYESIKLGLDKLNLMEYGQVTLTDSNFNFEGYVENQNIKSMLIADLKKELDSSYRGTYIVESPIVQIEEAVLEVVVAKTEVDTPEIIVDKVVVTNSTLAIAKAEVIEQSVVEVLSCQDQFRELLSQNKIHFEYDKADIKLESYNLLDSLVAIAKECPRDTITIEGHTDSDGSKSYNQSLSDKRATAVKKYLIEKDIAEDRVESIGYGEVNPLASNATPEGKEQNRRIEFNVKGAE